MSHSKFRRPLKSGYTYHIFNQGNNQENLFKEERNYSYFLKKYKEYISPIADTFAYCLLPNHFHAAIQIKSFDELHKSLPQYFPEPNLSNIDREFFNQEDFEYDKLISKKLSRRFASWFGAYSMAINKGYNRTGKLFNLPFKRVEVMDETYFTYLICYIHRNPIHHNFHHDFETWRHSSYNQILDYLKVNEMGNMEKSIFIDEFEVLNFPFLLNWFKDSNSFEKIHRSSLNNLEEGLWLE